MADAKCPPCPEGTYSATSIIGVSGCTLLCKSNAILYHGLFIAIMGFVQLVMVVAAGVVTGLRGAAEAKADGGVAEHQLKTEVAALAKQRDLLNSKVDSEHHEIETSPHDGSASEQDGIPRET
ncbi:hypothetical protein PSEUBRA_003401 [Kalmanozyma brasiliensis GHG001]|uniref:uncharacterized protein n=1 Tax=Kalmanozyma brasiliensis (strain GHG001) TaxID=1365824 RepID=UPI0028683654|nr:uncharacterized protein PSEUBRA_003401 [Kalmanozyma brasiliensis GHG001]KAF6767235.1 hypothetical protein PSEUBRA_003401 [Kalmanozyma brasiliensis GHG001]